MALVRFGFLALTLSVAACAGAYSIPDTARMPLNALGSNAEPDVYATQQAAWAFSDSSRTFGRPIEAARAAASLDYLAGQINTSPRWNEIGALTKLKLLQARVDMRSAIGVAPDASSQQVVDSLTSAANALAAGDDAGAKRALTTLAFPAGPEKTLAVLSSMPYIQTANVATQWLQNQVVSPGPIVR